MRGLRQIVTTTASPDQHVVCEMTDDFVGVADLQRAVRFEGGGGEKRRLLVVLVLVLVLLLLLVVTKALTNQ